MPTLADYRLLLGNLNGEESPANTTSRDNFINITIDDVWGRYQWPFRRATSNLTFINGVATLPTDFDIDGFYDLRLDDTNVYTLIEESYEGNYHKNVCWITGNTINIKETNPTLTLIYWKTNPVLSAPGDPCPIPSIVIARGAYALFKGAEDDEYDTTKLENKYESEIIQFKKQITRGKLKDSRLVSRTEQYGSYIGQVQ